MWKTTSFFLLYLVILEISPRMFQMVIWLTFCWMLAACFWYSIGSWYLVILEITPRMFQMIIWTTFCWMLAACFWHCPSSVSDGHLNDLLLNASCLLWHVGSYVVPFGAIVLAFMILQFLPLVIGLLNAAGKTNHTWHVHLLKIGYLLIIHWKLAPFGAIVTALFMLYFLPSFYDWISGS